MTKRKGCDLADYSPPRPSFLQCGRLAAGAAFVALAGSPAFAADGDEACPTFPPPTVTLDYGSRYDESSVDRSKLDEESDAEVDAALKDADSFIRQIAGLANDARANPGIAAINAACVINGIHGWAAADAFGKLETENAKMTYAARVGGIASAYRQVRDLADGLTDEKAAIEAWLKKNGDVLIEYWDNDAPPKARLGNLRLWAAYAVTEIALIVKSQDFINWAFASHRAVLATVGADGSMPYEMRRGKYALHYQLHALAPLTASAALICHNDYSYTAEEEAVIEKAVGFAFAGIEDPSKVAEIAGVHQSVPQGLAEQEPFTIAWLEAYLSLVSDGDLDRKLAPLRPLSNSKLGGDMTLLYRNNPAMQPGCFAGGK
ncbi:alginate lyase family protein [Martelella soudanensis]|uniref:alginate lyase family protein n=1 Tax=unclassified Martelella TaxID=2629616 RepID=UPI0015DF213B|nr:MULTISPECIES: alginate lyase family protein [unclassified Martelella]